jgi:hypothetical protein
MSHWNSYKDDPFFYEQGHNEEEERIDDRMEWEENNVPINVPMANVPMSNVPMANVPMSNVPMANVPMANVPMANVPMPAAPMENVPMPAAPMPPVQMPTAFYPFPPMYGCPPVIWCDPMVGGMTSFADDDFDEPDMSPLTMPLGMEAEPNMAMGGAGLPTSENIDPVTATTMPAGGTFAPSPMFPIAGMAPTVPFPTCGPVMPLGAMPTVYYPPASYYGGMAPYGPFFQAPYIPYR